MSEQPSSSQTSRRRRTRDRVLLVVFAVVVLTAAIYGGLAVRGHTSDSAAVGMIRPPGIPSTVSTSQAYLMALSPLGSQPAPDFRLTDQHGRTFSLSSLRGHVVVLGFSDPHCTDVCPIVSQETVDAYRDLGGAASNVVFVTVNVNPYVTGIPAMSTYTEQHQLSTVSSFHFVTGAVSDLQAVWKAYGIEVIAPDPTADVQHTDSLYFIDPQGRERYIASPTVDHTAKGVAYLPEGPLASWGRGIARVSQNLVST